MTNETPTAGAVVSLHGLPPDFALTYGDLGRIYNTTPGFFRRLHMQGKGPRAFKIGKFVRFHASDVAEWIESRKRLSTSPTPAERQARKVSPERTRKAG